MNCAAQQWSALKNSAPIFFARVKDADHDAIRQADLTSIRYTIYELDEDEADYTATVTGHVNVSLVIADTVFDALVTQDERWTADAEGYNFRFQPNVSTNSALPVAGRLYRVLVTIAPVTGQPILVAFDIRAV